MRKDKGKNIVIGILVVVIVGLIVLIGLMVSGKVDFRVENKEQKTLNESDLNQEQDEAVTFDVVYEDDSYTAKNNTGYYVISNKRNLPVITSNKYQEQASKIVAYLTKVSDETWNDANKQADEITDGMRDRTDGNLNFGVSYLMDTVLKKDTYLSIKLETSGSMGGTSWAGDEGYNFDILTGEVLEFNDIADDYSGLENVSFNEMVKYISRQSYSNDLVDNWQEILKENMFEVGSWYFTGDGIKFCLDKYLIGPGYIGGITNVVSYDTVNQYLKQEFRVE